MQQSNEALGTTDGQLDSTPNAPATWLNEPSIQNATTEAASVGIQENTWTAPTDGAGQAVAAENGQSSSSAALGAAVGLSLLGALVGAILWLIVLRFANMEVGYIALLIGALAGLGARFGSGGIGGLPLQALGAAMGVLGVFVAKYLGISYLMAGTSTFDGALIVGPLHFLPLVDFLGIWQENLGMADALWFGLAVIGAWRAAA